MKLLRAIFILSLGIIMSCQKESQKISGEKIFGEWQYDYTETYFNGQNTGIKGTVTHAYQYIDIRDNGNAYVEEKELIPNYNFNVEMSILTLNRNYTVTKLNDQWLVLKEKPVSHKKGEISNFMEFNTEYGTTYTYGNLTLYGTLCFRSENNLFGTDACLFGYYMQDREKIPCIFITGNNPEIREVSSIYDEAHHYYKRIN